jgi:hypothetical protein
MGTAALFPEYEAAYAELLQECVDLLMVARDPVLAQIKKVPAAHLPEKPTTPEACIGYQAPIGPVEMVFIMPWDDIIQGRVDGFAAAVSETADNALPQVMKEIFAQVNEVCDRGGTSIDAHGQKPSLDLLLNILDRMSIDFDEQGQPSLPTLVTTPEVARAFQSLTPTPEQEERLRAIFERKRKEFDAHRRIRKLDRRDK